MYMKRRNIMILLLVLLRGTVSIAQTDAHFSQYYAYPLWLNPAFTGMMNGDTRVTINYRKQLPSVYAPFTTQGITADMRLRKGFGIGFTALTMGAADAGYHYTTGYFSVSYRVNLSEYSILSSGFQLGLLNRKFDPSKLQFGSQYNPVMGYDPSLPSNEIFNYQSATSFDGSLGLMYFDADPEKQFNPFFGISLFHPGEPDNHFLPGTENTKIPSRFSIHGGARFQIASSAELIPHILFLQQGNATELAGGMVCNMNLDADKDLILGAMYRKDDAFVPSMGLHVGGLTIGFSYDFKTSDIKTATSSNGGYELSISFTNQKKTPDARMICPRF